MSSQRHPQMFHPSPGRATVASGIGPALGAPAPPLGGPSTVHQTLDLDDFRGKVPVIVVFLRELEELGETVSMLDEVHARAGHARVQLLAVVDRPIGDLLAFGVDYSIPMIADPELELSDSFSVPRQSASATIVVIDLDSVVVDVIVACSGGDLVAQLDALIDPSVP